MDKQNSHPTHPRSAGPDDEPSIAHPRFQIRAPSRMVRVVVGDQFPLKAHFLSLCHGHGSSRCTSCVKQGAWHPAIHSVGMIVVGGYSGETSAGNLINDPCSFSPVRPQFAKSVRWGWIREKNTNQKIPSIPLKSTWSHWGE